MKIIKPSAKLVLQENVYDHIVAGAKICYATEKEVDTYKFIKNLLDKGHKSPLRHGTVVLNLDKDKIEKSMFDYILDFYRNDPYSYTTYIVKDNSITNIAQIVTNMQVIIDNDRLDDLQYAIKDIYTDVKNPRYTFEVVTQISTSRELNRVSPNNITEQSTRFCNFAGDKFGNEITICVPHWFSFPGDTMLYKYDDTTHTHYVKFDGINDVFTPLMNANWTITKEEYKQLGLPYLSGYLLGCKEQGKMYIEFINDGMLAQDARGMLPLDTMTKCWYTYTLQEWERILDARYYGTTGTPHPNAKIIATQIREQLIERGHEFD
jgi:thymidylate synthase (FAD)